MKILVVTEKCSRSVIERDGGARLVETLQKALGHSVYIMQFGTEADTSAKWHFNYPLNIENRFERRLSNAIFIAEKVKGVESYFTHIIFVHVSMQFGIPFLPLRSDLHIWTFPMFLTPSYRASGEVVPEKYFEAEKLTLSHSKNILTPSHLEKRQLIEIYSIPQDRIHVVPRGIQRAMLNPTIRSLEGAVKFCSVGSIKPQKNTLGLVRLFAKARHLFPEATLQIIGPVQNTTYFSKIETEIRRLKLLEVVTFDGYIPPSQLPQAIEKAHLHLSASSCETFGRSIFETLACGLPNIARKTGNAAADFLEHLPYARFIDDDEEALEALKDMLTNLPKLSSLAREIGVLYDDEILSRLLTSKFHSQNLMGIADFDGTLYHKHEPERTSRCLNAFQKFPLKIICSARPIPDLLDQLKHYKLKVDWIIGLSGSIVANGEGNPVWFRPLDPDTASQIEAQIPDSKRVEFKDHILQIAVPAESVPSIFGLRSEIYQGIAFLAHWEASKLRAVHWLLRYIDWHGQVRAFGDGPYDKELLMYFDGTWIESNPIHKFQKREIEYA